MPSEPVIDELVALHAKWTKEAYEQGFYEGALAARDIIVNTIGTLPAIHPPGKPLPNRRRTTTIPGVPQQAANEQIFAFVQGALRELEESYPEGMFPDIVADFLRDNPPSGNGIDLKVPQVRAALRTMTLTGQARRMARGKYLPMPVNEMPVNDPPAA